MGYDRSSGVSLWPQDQAFLEVFEQLNKQNLEHFEEIKLGSKEALSRLESNLVLEVCHDNNWILPSDDGRTEGRMLDFFSGFVIFFQHHLSSVHSQRWPIHPLFRVLTILILSVLQGGCILH